MGGAPIDWPRVVKVRAEHAPSSCVDSSGLMGSSPAMQSLRASVEKIAASESWPPVLIVGATGSGKELVARALHAASSRSHAPFVDLNCAAIAPSLFESQLFGHQRGAFTGAQDRNPGCLELAAGGVLFLDEIGEMPLDQQAKLLRALESRTYRSVGSTLPKRTDAWFIAATNVDLESRVRAGLFRSDLFYRVKGAVLRAPALLEHPEDIRELAEHFAGRLKPPVRIAEDGLAWLGAQLWDGNVRELKMFVEHAAVFSDDGELTRADFERARRRNAATTGSSKPSEHGERSSGMRRVAKTLDEALRETENGMIDDALATCGGNKTAAADLLGIDRNRLMRILKNR